MAMSFSQYEICFCISRENDISHEMQNLSMQRMSLTRNMNEVTRKYKDNISAKTYKWSNNSGVTYTDLSYKTLMTPNSNNQWNPVLLTNSDGRVIIDSNYEKYAKMIDQNGGYSGATREKILNELTGISKDCSDENTITTKLQQKEYEYKTHLAKESDYIEYISADEFYAIPGVRNVASLGLSAWVNQFVLDDIIDYTNQLEWAPVSLNYFEPGGDFIVSSQTTVNLSDAITDLSKIIDDYYNAFAETNCISQIDLSCLHRACENIKLNIQTVLGCGNNYNECVKIYGNFISFDLSAFKDELDTYYQRYQQSTDSPSQYSKKKADWEDWYATKLKLEQELSNLRAQQQSSGNSDYYLTEEDRRLIAFYDQIFTAVDEKGWKVDYNINDSEYLNQMLQNNLFYVTTMKENDDKCCNNDLKYIYDIDLASNFMNIFSVNDTAKQNEALAEYEYEKSIISAKENVIDTRMANLETELKAVQGKKETLERNLKDNVDRTMSLFG